MRAPTTLAQAHTSRHDNDHPHQVTDEKLNLADERIWRGVKKKITFAHVPDVCMCACVLV